MRFFFCGGKASPSLNLGSIGTSTFAATALRAGEFSGVTFQNYSKSYIIDQIRLLTRPFIG